MPGNIINTIMATVKQLFSDQIIDNRLNPVHVAIASKGHQFQSRVLHIPDRFGLFSPGPPRLQAAEGFQVVFMSCILGFVSLPAVVAVLLARLKGRPVLLLALGLAAMIFSTAIFFWVGVCSDRRRSPDYDWGEWKLRTE
ncbi:hypothetical protein TARUN_8877 [Trichoderma arundinaceum]|uniref:Uncharacterized protein n=1 Tax=Trichoderma arundinaceum TaxID=490622 RepID=A0A395NBA3_TRIAR|nr:hypothetical protein TARUN_8877 [Trichoderma arundinaceum]